MKLFRILSLVISVILSLPGCVYCLSGQDLSWKEDVSFVSPVDYSKPTDRLRVYVGYFGGPYYEKTVFSVDGDGLKLGLKDGGSVDASQMSDKNYSYIDGSGTVVIVRSKGIYLDDFLELAGVDGGSVSYFHFRTTDNETYSFSSGDLYAAARYYYPELKKYSKVSEFESRRDEMLSFGEEVKTMLALQTQWKTEGLVNQAVRLVFGQQSPTEHRSNDSAKWIHTAVIQLGGTPQIKMNFDLDQKVGSLYQVTVNFAAVNDRGRTEKIDDTVAQELAEGLELKSSNRNAVDVVSTKACEDGSVQVMLSAGKGTAQLSVKENAYDGDLKLPSAVLEAKDEKLSLLASEGAVSTDTELPAGTEDLSENTVRSSTGNRSEATGISRSTGSDTQQAAQDALLEGTMPDTKNASVVNSILVHPLSIDSNEGGVQNRRETEMAEDASPLAEKKTKALFPQLCLWASVFFLLGIGIHLFWYRRETKINVE